MSVFIENYLQKGYSILRNMDVSLFVEKAKDTLSCDNLLSFHHSSHALEINSKRLELSNIFSNNIYKNFLYNQIKEEVALLVGSELVIQKRVNVTLHPPGVENNITPFHSDVLCGNSPFEVVVWVPLCSVEGTQSMYVFDKIISRKILTDINKCSTRGELLHKYRNEMKYLNLNEGDILFFSPTLIHGSSVNLERNSRVSVNLRFKNYHSPYGVKTLGEYFEPLSMTAQSIVANEYINEH